MTTFMSFRGPDAQNIWIEGTVGFGHTLLRTTFESQHEKQPFSLDGKVWITADARVDGRDELKNKLETNGRVGLAEATDVELILHAYHTWGENCVKHLIGDFAFAIWDVPRRQLFCARDHFGVKPFFYAHVKQCLIFSNTLNCVRRHPDVSNTLNDLAIADFLLFEQNRNPETTAFSDIRRLPPAHSLIWSANELTEKCYWTLPTDLGVKYRKAGDYVEHFKQLLGNAVADRLRTDRVGIEMSGGLDSSSIAATALAELTRQSKPFELHALTFVYDRLIPDQERHYSGLVATKLGLPQKFFSGDDYKLYERFDQPETHLPEPFHNPLLAMGIDIWRGLPAHGRVFLTGWDGDALLNESPKPYFRKLLEERKIGRLLMGVLGYAVSQRKLVPAGFLDWLKGGGTKHAEHEPPFPPWLNPDLVARLDLRARWEQVHATKKTSHPIRPYAYGIYAFITRLSNFFEDNDAGLTLMPIEFRHPLMDVRLLEYCLSLPPMPWCVKKEILRSAMQGALPEPILKRPKTPLAGNPQLEILRQTESRWLDHFVALPALAKYVDISRIPALNQTMDHDEKWKNLRPLSLNYWLKGLVEENF